jgi:uncharacterized membrane protein YoaK (UPF0700 family)
LISQLPRWVETGAFLLAFLAGSVNAVGFLGFQHQAVSHLSGTTTILGAELASVNFLSVTHLLLILLSFVFGAALSGILIRHTALKLGRNYGVALLIEGALLFAAMMMLLDDSTYGHYLASAACGLQNAMATTFSGAVIRTTHLTGIFTDLGIMLGAKLRGVSFDKRRVILYLLLIGGFVSGGIAGSLLFKYVDFFALALPATMTIFIALSYWVFALQQAK